MRSPEERSGDSLTHRHKGTLKGVPGSLGGGAAGGAESQAPGGVLEKDQRLARLFHCTVSRQMQTFKMAFISKSNFVKSQIRCRKGDRFQAPRGGSCLTLRSELSEEIHMTA